MMKRDILNLNFLRAVNEKIPNKTELANYLVSILQIEKEAVYRRLRSEVPFTFAEVASVGEQLGISLDTLIGINTKNETKTSFFLNDFESPSDQDMIIFNNYINILKVVKRDPNSELNEVWNTLPWPLIFPFEHIVKYYIFKWRYLLKPNTGIKRYEDIFLTSRLIEIHKKQLEEYKNIKHSSFIIDSLTFYKLVQDIQYFHSIHLITNENIQEIKKDLYRLLDYTEELSRAGVYKETGNSVTFYISNIEIETSYSYLEARSYTLCLLHTFILNTINIHDTTTCATIKEMITLLKNQSPSLALHTGKDLISYINEQKKIIDSL